MGDRAEHIYFEEEQHFRQPWIWVVLLLSLGVPFFVFGYALLQQLVLEKPFGDKPLSDLSLAITAVSIFILDVGALLLFFKMKLVIRLDSAHLHIRFYPFMQRDIPLSKIADWEARTYRPIREYGGWGIKWGPGGRAYNVSGTRGVQLQLTDGKRLLLGSQHAEELATTITLAKSRSR